MNDLHKTLRRRVYHLCQKEKKKISVTQNCLVVEDWLLLGWAILIGIGRATTGKGKIYWEDHDDGNDDDDDDDGNDDDENGENCEFLLLFFSLNKAGFNF